MSRSRIAQVRLVRHAGGGLSRFRIRKLDRNSTRTSAELFQDPAGSADAAPRR